MSDKMPSFFQMVKNFTNEVTEYAKAGAPNVSVNEYSERVNECDACPNLNREKMRCTMCGCYIEHKAKWKTASCPDNRWPK